MIGDQPHQVRPRRKQQELLSYIANELLDPDRHKQTEAHHIQHDQHGVSEQGFRQTFTNGSAEADVKENEKRLECRQNNVCLGEQTQLRQANGHHNAR